MAETRNLTDVLYGEDTPTILDIVGDRGLTRVDTIEDMLLIDAAVPTAVLVDSNIDSRGGLFIYDDFLSSSVNSIDLYDGWVRQNLNKKSEVNRNISHLPMLAYTHQFGGTTNHYLSNNAIVVNGDSVTQGANAGNYMDNGYVYKVRRELMKRYKSKSFGYLSVDNKDGYITAPNGAYRWYEPTTNGSLYENESAPNSIGGTEAHLGTSEYVKFQFNREDKFMKELIPNQNKYRIVFNDSTGSVRITADGIGYSIDEVVTTDGTNISAVLSLPPSWDGIITITAESGNPIINGIVLLYTEDDYAIHLIYNGGRALVDISVDTMSKIVTNADLYIHALGINDGWGTVTETNYNTSITNLTTIINTSKFTRVILLDFMWIQNSEHFTRIGLQNLSNNIVNENSLINLPYILANGGAELSTTTLASESYKFLSTDKVHPFINGHQMIAILILSELGIYDDMIPYPRNSDLRSQILNDATSTNFNFSDISKLVIGWSSDGLNSISHIENQGTNIIGYIYNGYIETRIPITETQSYTVTIDIENIDSTGVHSFGTKSLDSIGNEIYEQDGIGSIAGNMTIVNKSIAIGTREKITYVVGGTNDASGTDSSKFEPNAHYWNLALILNNGDTSGNIIIHGINIVGGVGVSTVTQTQFQTDWAPDIIPFTIDFDKKTGVVQFDGWVTKASAISGDSMFILNSKYRPPVQLEFYQVDKNGNPIKIRIETGGYVRVYSIGSNAGWNEQVQLSNIKYKVE